jgi:two-component sensor histidine kinase
MPTVQRLLSLRLRLIFLVAGTALPLIIFSAAIVYLNFRADRENAGARLIEIARSMMIAVDRELEGRIAALEVLSQSQALAEDDLPAFRSRAAVFLSRQAPGANLVLIGRDGQQLLNMRLAPGASLPKVAPADIEKVFQTGRPTITDYRIGAAAGRPIITVDVPVFRDGKVVHVLSLNPTIELFAELIARQRPQSDWVVAVFDGAGVVVARTPNPDRFLGQRASPTLYPELRARTEGLLDTTSLEGTVVYTAFSRSPTTGWSVAIGVPRTVFTRPLWRSIVTTVATGLILLLIGLAFAISMATHMARAAAHRELLINELNHRVKNTLASVQSIISRTLRGAAGHSDSVKTLEARLMALSRTHNVLSAENWDSAELHDIAMQSLAPYAAGDRTRLRVDGPAVRLRPRAALTVSMVLHELSTNAAKYGALSNASGRVSLTWSVRNQDQGPWLRLVWRESGGPPVQPSDRKGFGSTLIDKGIAHELGGTTELNFDPPGVNCTIEFPLAATQSAGDGKRETVSSNE